MRIIDGKRLAFRVLGMVESEVKQLTKMHPGKRPGLAVVHMGSRADSAKYVERKRQAAHRCGFVSVQADLPEACSQSELLGVISNLNQRDDVDGILVQLPLPSHCDQQLVLEALDAGKDVDGFHPRNIGGLTRLGEVLRQNRDVFKVSKCRNMPCTPLGIMELLDDVQCQVNGKHAVILGRSNIVGLPTAMMLLHRNATVTICHSKTPNIKEICRQGDIVIAAMGKAQFVKSDWIKPGACVIDVGINFIEDASKPHGVRLCGDVDFDDVAKVAGSMTPVPGGVGPMTVAMLMMNTLNNFKKRVKSSSDLPPNGNVP